MSNKNKSAVLERSKAEPVEIKEVVVHADYRQLWIEQVSMNQKLSAALSAPQPSHVNQQLLEALKAYMLAYADAWVPGMDILEPMGDAAIAAAERGEA